jgi:tetratricopeptide (TPR) repeat protein
MKKLSITFLVAGLLSVAAMQAQTIQEGVNDLYAERNKSAKATFEKLLAANPNNIDASYWLGQTYIAMDNAAGARDIYSKALLASANAPLLIVGMGQVELIENKTNEARQRFEAAITLTRGKKGDDPVILNAIGRAIVNTYTEKEKKGDINYAVEKLEAAAARDDKNAEIFLNLGTAYRKAKPGEGGGKAFESYKKGNVANPNFAPPYHRLAQLFNSQKNYELYEQYLNEAIAHDPRYAPAYYDLYYLKLGKLDFTSAEDYAKKYIANSDPDPQNDYLRVQTLWAKKDFDGAIAGAKNIIAQAGASTKARVHKLIADSYVQKGDTAAAKPFIDEYFTKAKPEELTALDYGLKATIYSVIPGQEDVVYNSILEGVRIDTVIDNKIKTIKDGADLFKRKGLREKEGDLISLLIQVKPKPTINDMFDAARAYYFGLAYTKSADMALKMIEKYPEEVYGYDWAVNNYKVLDSSFTLNQAVPAAIKLLEFSQKDTAKYKKYYLSAAGFLVQYYANVAKDREKAIEYLKKMIEIDPSNEVLKGNLELLQKTPKPTTPRTTAPKTGKLKKIRSGTGSEVAKL